MNFEKALRMTQSQYDIMEGESRGYDGSKREFEELR